MMIDVLLKFARSRLTYLASICPKAFVQHLGCTTCSACLHSSPQSQSGISVVTVGAVCSEHRVLESKFIAFYHCYQVILQDMVINYVVDTWQKSLASAHSRLTKVSEKDVIFLLRKVSLISSGFCKRNCETFISIRIFLGALHLRTTWHVASYLATALGDQLRCSELAAWQRTICFLPRFISYTLYCTPHAHLRLRRPTSRGCCATEHCRARLV